MKKKRGIIVATALVLCLSALVLLGCNSKVDPPKEDPSPDPKSEYYLAQMKAVQLAETVVDDNGNEEVRQAKLIGKERIENIIFLQYEIGTIENCFVQPVCQPFYWDGGVGLKEYQAQSLTATTISNGIANAISTTDSVSICKSHAESETWGFSREDSASLQFGISVGLENIINIQSGLAVTRKDAYNYSKTMDNSENKTVAESVTKNISEQYDTSSLQQQSATAIYNIDMEKYPVGRYYALSLITDVTVYQVIAYDVELDELFTTYFVGAVPNTPSAFSLQMLWSDNKNFNVTPEYQLSPISEIGKELFEVEGIDVEVDLSSFYALEGETTLADFQDENYDASRGVYKIYGSKDFQQVDQYIFRGFYGLSDRNGKYVTGTLKGLSLEIHSEHDIAIVFANMAFTGTTGLPVIYPADSQINRNITVTVVSSGLANYIHAADASDSSTNNQQGANGCDVINVNNLVIGGNVNLSIYAGKGGDCLADGVGGNGGNGIVCESLTISNNANVMICGGNGGMGATGAKGNKGGDGSYGSSYGVTLDGNPGEQGDVGYNGGRGGAAVAAKEIIIDANTAFVSFVGGTGGTGGIGGRGGDGGNGRGGDALHYNGSNGGAGGKGGTGGSGGVGGAAIADAESVTVLTGNLVVSGGTGGIGGTGGNGGNGGDGAWRWGAIGSIGEKGNAGSGGDGGNGGNGGVDCECLISAEDAAQVMRQNGEAGAAGSAGADGAGLEEK